MAITPSCQLPNHAESLSTITYLVNSEPSRISQHLTHECERTALSWMELTLSPVVDKLAPTWDMFRLLWHSCRISPRHRRERRAFLRLRGERSLRSEERGEWNAVSEERGRGMRRGSARDDTGPQHVPRTNRGEPGCLPVRVKAGYDLWHLEGSWVTLTSIVSRSLPISWNNRNLFWPWRKICLHFSQGHVRRHDRSSLSEVLNIVRLSDELLLSITYLSSVLYVVSNLQSLFLRFLSRKSKEVDSPVELLSRTVNNTDLRSSYFDRDGVFVPPTDLLWQRTRRLSSLPTDVFSMTHAFCEVSALWGDVCYSG